MTSMRFVDLPASAVARLDPQESDWTDWVIARAKEAGYRVAHFLPARTTKGWRTSVQGHRGSPDLLLAKDGTAWLVELKRNGTYPDPEQRVWLAALGSCAEVWRPRDAEKVIERLSASESPVSAQTIDVHAGASERRSATTQGARARTARGTSTPTGRTER